MQVNQTTIVVQYQEHLGSDLSVVNAARASFGKESDWVWVDAETRTLKESDANLIRYLATGYRTSEWLDFLDEIVRTAASEALGYNDRRAKLTDLLHAYKRRAQHWAPFAHPQVRLRMTVPIFVARQLAKHQHGGVWSEESRRYISSAPECWFPEKWHDRPQDVKQGSGSALEGYAAMCADSYSTEAVDCSLKNYVRMLEAGVAPEEARMVLPQNTMTTVVWTGSLLFWARVYNQRADSHAQRAGTQEFAQKLGEIMEPLYPVSWAALTR